MPEMIVPRVTICPSDCRAGGSDGQQIKGKCVLTWQALDVRSPGRERVVATDYQQYRWCFHREAATMHAGSVLAIAALRSLTSLKISGYSVRCSPEYQDRCPRSAHITEYPPACRTPPPVSCPMCVGLLITSENLYNHQRLWQSPAGGCALR